LKPEDTIDFHLRSAWAKIARFYNAEAAKFGGSMAVGYILLNIDKEGTPATKLGPKMGMEPKSLTRTLKSMEAMGLIEKRPSTDDKRLVRLFLTDKGKAMRATSKEVVISFNHRLRASLGEEGFQKVLSALSGFNQQLNENLLET
jgi:MarR family transcriptional regulator, organic hydroperoxide resistance regulator